LSLFRQPQLSQIYQIQLYSTQLYIWSLFIVIVIRARMRLSKLSYPIISTNTAAVIESDPFQPIFQMIFGWEDERDDIACPIYTSRKFALKNGYKINIDLNDKSKSACRMMP
jgi:hypothetical protein